MQLTTALKITETYKTGNEYAKSHPDWLQYGVVYLAQYKEAKAMADKFYLFFDYEIASMSKENIKNQKCYQLTMEKVQNYLTSIGNIDADAFIKQLKEDKLITK